MADVIINGGDVIVTLAGNEIAHATSHSLNISMSARETSSKTNGIYVNRESGRLDVTGSIDGLAFYSTTTGIQYLLGAIVARTKVALIFKQKAASASYATGNFFITSAELGAPDQDNATYSITFEHADGFALGSFTP